MNVERTRRTGALTHRALVDAVMDERERGREPALLVVGGVTLERLALHILKDDGPLGALRGASPAVVRVRGWRAHEWELREQGDIEGIEMRREETL